MELLIAECGNMRKMAIHNKAGRLESNTMRKKEIEE